MVLAWALAVEPTGEVEAPDAEVLETATREEAAVEPEAPRPVQPPRFIEPHRIAGRDRRPTGRTTQRFTDRSPLVRPALRLAPGFSGRFGDRPYAAFAFDALASILFGLHGGRRQWGLAPEIGYSLRAPGIDHQVLGGVGLVYGINAEHATLGWLPRGVLQPTPEGIGLGVRNGLWFDFAENGFSVELSHQWLRLNGNEAHELRLSLGLDLAMLMVVLTDSEIAWL